MLGESAGTVADLHFYELSPTLKVSAHLPAGNRSDHQKKEPQIKH